MTKISALSAFEMNKKNKSVKVNKKKAIKKKKIKSSNKLIKPDLGKVCIEIAKKIKKQKKVKETDKKDIGKKNDDTKKTKRSKQDLSENYKLQQNLSILKTKNIMQFSSEIKKSPKKFMTFSCENKNSLIFLQEGENLLLEGSGMVECVVGRCCINGYEFQHGQKHPVHSIGPHYSLEALPSPHVPPSVVRETLEKCGLMNEDVLKFIKEMKESDLKCALIVFEKYQNEFLSKMAGLKAYNNAFNLTGDLRAVEGKDEVVWGEEHERVVQHWKGQAGTAQTRMVVAGDRNTGKSTFLRHLINHSLSHMPQIAYLECDPGQTEFAAPGCVSLTIVTTPLLGPPFTHTHTPVLTCFTGAVTPSQHPHHYLQCVEYVMERYVSQHSSTPLLINTMGWMQGLGMELLVALVAGVHASTLVHLYEQQLHPLDHSSLSKLRRHSMLRRPSPTDPPLHYHYFPIQISFNAKGSSKGRATPACLRNLKLLSCLHQPSSPTPSSLHSPSPIPSSTLPSTPSSTHLLAFRDPLLGSPFYCIEGVPLRLCHAGHACSSLHACVVSLCRFDKAEDDLVGESVGMGVVHGVHEGQPGDSRVYITTNVPPLLLANVNCLLAGSVKVPMELLGECDMRPVDRPGLNYQKDVFGSTSIKAQRKFIPRKRSLSRPV